MAFLKRLVIFLQDQLTAFSDGGSAHQMQEGKQQGMPVAFLPYLRSSVVYWLKAADYNKEKWG